MQNSLDSLKNDHKIGSDALNREIETLKSSLATTEAKYTQVRGEFESEEITREEAQRSLEEGQAEI